MGKVFRHGDRDNSIDFKKGQIMTTNIENNWADCVCDALADCCGALSPCAIPGLLNAIENHQWSKAAYLIIQAGECTLEIEVIVPVLAFASAACLLADAGFDLHPAQQDILDKEIERIKGE